MNQDPQKNMKSYLKRLIVVGSSLFFLFAILILQFFKIQIIEGKKWKQFAGKQHYFDVIEPFVRGTFYSNTALKKGHPESTQKLAFDIRKYHLYIDPSSIPPARKKEISAELLALSKPTTQEIKLFFQQFDKKCRSRKLASWIDEQTKDNIYSWWKGYAKKHKIAPNAVYFVGDTLRSHPFGKLLGQILHTVQLQKDDRSQQSYPTGGLELSLHKYLKGKIGKRRLMRSPRHALETQIVIGEPENGADVYLTINHFLQAICEEEIEKGVKQCKAKCGWALMLDPFTGEVLALAQYPFFFPDQYQQFYNDKNRIEDTKVKALTDANEPGSIMKPISLAIALKANKILRDAKKKELFHPDEKITTSKGNFPGRSKPITDTHLHYYLNMPLGLQKSSNIYVATLIHRVTKTFGDAWYRNELLNTFGFGKKTGIELPSESSGLLPTPGKKHPNGKLEWSVPTPFSLAMGHNIQATSFQMARAYAMFANGGYLVTPTLIKKIVKKDANGKETVLVDNTTNRKTTELPRVVDPDIIKEVVRCMKYVTKQGGAAPQANIWGYTEAGKTGTSMKIVGGTYSDKKHISTFVGFSPLSNPAFVLLVAMDEPLPGFVPGKGPNHHGGLACAPVFREIGQRTLEYLGLPPDDPHGYPIKDPRFNADKADWYKEAEKLRELYNQWNRPHR